MVFVHVADAGRGLQPQDVQAWHAWVARTRAPYPNPLAQAIAELAADFPALWKQHVARGNPTDVGPVVHAWAHWHVGAQAQAQLVLSDLAVLLEACAPTTLPLWARLLRRKPCSERLAARSQVLALLQQHAAVAG